MRLEQATLKLVVSFTALAARVYTYVYIVYVFIYIS
jgi:hypothetical protein